MDIFRLLKTGLITGVVLVLCLPAPLTALGVVQDSGPMALQTTAPVIITELQTGSSASGKSDEFIELYNTSDKPIDITGWQLRYVNASNETATPSTIAAVTPPDGEVVAELPPHSYYVLRTPSVLVTEAPGQVYDAKLSNADKAVMLLRPDEQTCQYVLEDALAWGASTRGEGDAVAVPTTQKTAERHMQRYRDQSGHYIDTNTNHVDASLSAAQASQQPFLAQDATPGAPNSALKHVASPLEPEPLAEVTLPMTDCELPVQPEDPEPPVTLPPTTEPPIAPVPQPAAPEIETPASRNVGLISPQLTEVLPNPASPQTDAADEFIELYNPNDTIFQLEAYALVIGKRRYVFPEGSQLEAKAFKAFFSADTRLALPNSGGTVAVADPFGNVIASLEPYGVARDGQAWARADGQWAWTATPTPHAANAMVAPQPKKKASSTVKTSKATTNASSTAKDQTASQTAAATSIASITPETPIHGSILVLIGVFAVLYGAYEYRHDIRNHLYRLRSYRATRSETRRELKRRRGS